MSISPPQVAKRGRSRRRALVAMALLALSLGPLGAAEPSSGTLTTKAPIEGSGPGSVAFTPTTVQFEPVPHRPIVPDAPFFLHGQRGVLREFRDENVRANGATANPLYNGHRYDLIQARDIEAFDLRALEFLDNANLAVRTSGSTLANLSLTTDFSVEVRSANDVQAGTGTEDPRHDFLYDAAGVLAVRVANACGPVKGDFDVLLEGLRFEVRTPLSTDAYRTESRTDVDAGPAGGARNTTFFVLEVHGGNVHPGLVPAASKFRTALLTVDMDGLLRIPDASGVMMGAAATSPASHEGVELRGLLKAVFQKADLADGSAGIAVRVEQTDSATSAGAADAASVAASGLALVGLRLALAAVAIAVVGFGTHRWGPSLLRTPAAAPAKSPTTADEGAKPSSGDRVGRLEDAFKARPDDAATALELGVTYVKSGRPEDALPLLLMSIQAYPKTDVARYYGALALLQAGRVAEAATQLNYAFRLNPINVALFLREPGNRAHARHPEIASLLHRWSRQFHESTSRGYA